ncbi:MAG: serine/threonine protein kinase, partial [Cyanobacteria bacterium HKST-UBA02]|nr:serine/threonine protein kinase [Cyanobacteria bacterium HKST-UBA02]
LKPSNIMIVRDGHDRRIVKLLDFGLAKILDAEDPVKLSATGVAMGSPAYMSPEQATAHGVDHRSDLYAMGCIIYEMIAGDPPLLGDSPTETLIKRLNGIVPALRESTNRPVDPDMEAIVTRLLEREQDDRYQSAEEVLTALAAVRKRIERKKEEREQGVRPPLRRESQAEPSQRDTVKDIKLNEFTEGRVMVFDPPLRRLVLQSAGAGEHFEPVIIPEGWMAELRAMPLPLKVVVILLMVMSAMLTLRSMIY